MSRSEYDIITYHMIKLADAFSVARLVVKLLRNRHRLDWNPHRALRFRYNINLLTFKVVFYAKAWRNVCIYAKREVLLLFYHNSVVLRIRGKLNM